MISLDDLAGISEDYAPDFAFGLNILNVYQELYRTEYRFVRRRGSFVVAFKKRSRHSPYLEASFGSFPKYDSLSYIQRSYQDVFSPTILNPEPSAWLRIVQERGHTPLTFTRHGLSSHSHTAWNLTEFLSLRDIADFTSGDPTEVEPGSLGELFATHAVAVVRLYIQDISFRVDYDIQPECTTTNEVGFEVTDSDSRQVLVYNSFDVSIGKISRLNRIYKYLVHSRMGEVPGLNEKEFV